MSLALAVPLGIGSALVYGTSIVFQHDEANQQGEPDARGLLALLRNPRWLLAIAGDFVGFLLQMGALSAGSVVVIQPLVVLMLPVALVVGSIVGRHRPGRAEYLSSFAIIAGLGAFLVLIGTPGAGHVPRARYVAMTVLIVLVVGVAGCLVVTGRATVVRAATYGIVSGVYFGALGVMVDASATHVSEDGWKAMVTTGCGLIPLIGILLLGVGGIVLTQISFALGALGATLPASLAADPFTGVLIGALLLREHLPHDPGHMIGYALCLVAVVVGALRLANPPPRRPQPAGST